MGAPVSALGAVLGTTFQEMDLQQQSVAANEDADANKRTALRAAADAIARGNAEAAKTRGQGTQLAARQQVAFAASGVDATVGTAAELQAGTRMLSEHDARVIENNAAREAWGFKETGRQVDRQNYYTQQRLRNQMLGMALGGAGKLAGDIDFEGK